MSADDPTELIQLALNEFDVPTPTVELLEYIDHYNAKVVSARGSFFLKILASDHTEEELCSRLHFVEFLRDGGLNVPSMIATRAGRRFASLSVGGDERLAVMSRWIDGQLLGDQIDDDWSERCGVLLARLHVRSQEYDPPEGFQVRTWDDVCVPAEDGWLRPFLASTPVDDAAQDVIKAAAARTRIIDAQLPRVRQNYGLIHADFHGDNLIFDGETIWIVDLDDVGWGHFFFDVAWPAVLSAKHHPERGEFLAPFLRGYERLRPISFGEKELLPEFLLAAGMGALEMIDSSPIANDSPKAQQWLRFIVAWLRRHLK